MTRKGLRILQVAPSDRGGGAECCAHNLFHAYRRLGQGSWLAVGDRHSDDADVIAIPNFAARNAWVRCFDRAVLRADHGGPRGVGRAARWLRAAGEPSRVLGIALGHEDFHHPGSRGLLDLVPEPVDLVHLHNLHGNYFDLEMLPRLSARVPTVLNLHDAWLLSGHCAYPLGCERWKHGCGRCPDLDLYPAIRRDGTAFNWRRKRELFQRSRLYVTAPSNWLLERARDSILAPAMIETRVIGNGVDTAVFNPEERRGARARLGIDEAARVIVTAANGIRSNPWKDYASLRGAIERLGARQDGVPLVVLAVGESAPEERLPGATIRFVPFVSDGAELADHYRAADVYVHAARVESFGNTLLEAAACGTPVVSTAVGGIPEHVNALDCPPAAAGIAVHGPGDATGILTAPADPQALAAALSLLLEDAILRDQLGGNGARRARDRWSLDRQADAFLGWYREIVATTTAVS